MMKILKWLGIILLFIVLIGAILGWLAHEPRPATNPSKQADQMAEKMLTAINYEAWDTTRYVRWTFSAGHDFFWDKKRNFVEVKWRDKKVHLHTKSVTGVAYENGQQVGSKDADKLIQTAWSHFCNDSWWLNAPAKAFDPGTVRSIVTTKDGRQGLMVSYESGGVTPGDAYIWFLADDGLPKSYKMWVKIIPVGGLEFTWEDWTDLPTGAKIATDHKSSLLNIPITNLKAGDDWSSFGYENDPFVFLEK